MDLFASIWHRLHHKRYVYKSHEERGENEWTLTSNLAIQLVASYLPRVSSAVCASDPTVRAMTELKGPVQTIRVPSKRLAHMYSSGTCVMAAHALRFEYNDEHTEYAECIVDVRDVRRVKLVVWWLQVVGVRSLSLEGMDYISDEGVQHVLSVLFTERSLTTTTSATSKALPLVLEELTYDGFGCTDGGSGLFGLLKQCQSLRALRIGCYALNSLDPMQSFTTLEVLHLYCYNLRSIAPLAACPRLRKLTLSNCQNLRSLEGLEKLSRLTELSVCGMEMDDLTQLCRCEELHTLSLLECHQLRSFMGAEKLILLTNLRVHASRLHDLTTLSDCRRLRYLNLTRCPNLCSLAGLEKMSWLVELDLSETGVTDLTPLHSCVRLKYLNLTHCHKLRNLSGVENLPELETISLSKDMSHLNNSAPSA